MKDILIEIWETAKRNKMRTALTGFAVAWGIFMIIFLLGAGNGLINAQMIQKERFLDNSIIVAGGYTSKPYKGFKEGRWINLNTKDLDFTCSKKHVVDEISPSKSKSDMTFTYKNNYVSNSIEAVSPADIKINKKEMLCGRFIDDIDMSQKRKTVVISESDAKELMPHDTKAILGQYININDIAFRVVGIYKTDKSGHNNNNYIPFTTFMSIFTGSNDIDMIAFSFHGLNDERSNELFEDEYRAGINANHQVAPDDKSALRIWNMFTQSIQMQQGIGIIHTFLWIVGLFTLLSGVVGVSNIMLITVKERTREFGIRKAIGAKPASILRLVIAESIIITTIFGYIGMLAGIVANEYMDATIGHTTVKSGLFEATMFYNPTVGLDVCAATTLVMIIAGTMAGLVPATKAAKIKPIEALRAE